MSTYLKNLVHDETLVLCLPMLAILLQTLLTRPPLVAVKVVGMVVEVLSTKFHDL